MNEPKFKYGDEVEYTDSGEPKHYVINNVIKKLGGYDYECLGVDECDYPCLDDIHTICEDGLRLSKTPFNAFSKQMQREIVPPQAGHRPNDICVRFELDENLDVVER